MSHINELEKAHDMTQKCYFHSDLFFD